MALKARVLRVVAIATAVAMVFGAFAGGASAKKISKAQKAKIAKQLRKQIKKNPRAIRSKSFLRKAALVNFKLPVTIRLRGECPAGSGGAAACPSDTVGTRGNTGLNERGTASANVDLGPSLGQRPVNLRGSLAAEVQFRDSYDGGALGNVSIEILPSTHEDARHQLGSAAVEPGCQLALVAHRCELRPCGDSRRRVGRPGPARPTAGRTSSRAARSSRTRPRRARVRSHCPSSFAGGVAGDGSYSALWYGTLAAGPERWSAGLPGHRPGRSASTSPAYFLPVFPGIDSLDNLTYGTGFPATGDPDEYLGSTPTPFPYPAVDPDPSVGRSDDRQQRG